MRKVEDIVYDGTVYDSDNIDEIIFPYKAANILVNMYKDLQVEINRLCTHFTLTPINYTLTNITDFPTIDKPGVHIATAVNNNNTFIDAAEDIRSTLQTILTDESTYNSYSIAPKLNTQVKPLIVNQTFVDARIVNTLQRNIRFMIEWMKITLVVIDKILLHESLTTIAPTNVTYTKATGNTTIVKDETIAPINSILGDVVSVESTYMDRTHKARQNLRYLSTDGNYYVVTYDFELGLIIGTKRIANGAYPDLTNAQMIAAEPGGYNQVSNVRTITTGWSYEGNFYVTHQIKSSRVRRSTDGYEYNAIYCKSEKKDENGNVVDTFTRRIYLASGGTNRGAEIRESQLLTNFHYNSQFMFAFHLLLQEYGYSNNYEIRRFFAFLTTFSTSLITTIQYGRDDRVFLHTQKLFVYSFNGNVVIRTMMHGGVRFGSNDTGFTVVHKCVFNGISFSNSTDQNYSWNSDIAANMIVDANTDSILYWSAHLRYQNNWIYGWLKVWKDSVVTLDSYIQSSTTVTWNIKYVVISGMVRALWKRSTASLYSLTNFLESPVDTTLNLPDRLWNLFPAMDVLNLDNEKKVYEDGQTCFYLGKTFVFNHTITEDYVTYINSLPLLETTYFTYKRTIDDINTELIELTGSKAFEYRIKHNATTAQNLYIFEE